MRNLAILTTAVAGLALSGCLGSGGSGVNRSMESVHQPVVTQHNFVLDVPVEGGELSPAALGRVSGWIDAMDVRYGDRISIDESGTYGARPARDAVDELLRRKGMLLSENAPITPGAIAPGSIRVIISRASARVDGCPNWRTRSSTDFYNQTSSNYGCATNANVAAMVADPLDLVRGQSDRSNDPLTASNAVNGYRGRASQNGGQLPATQGTGSTAAPGGGGR